MAFKWFENLIKPSFSLKNAWKQGLKNEPAFWEDLLLQYNGRIPRTYPQSWYDDISERFDPDLPLQEWVQCLLPDSANKTLRMLDVGSGPLTVFGKKVLGANLEIIATDPLADEYAQVLRKLSIEPLVKCMRCYAEEIHMKYPADSYDLVVSHNALDHCYDPIAAINSALAVTKPGCWVSLWHEDNEGVRQSYEGLHQWNFTSEDGQFVIWSKEIRYADILGMLPQAQKIVCEQQYHHDTEWLHTRILKQASISSPA